MSNIPRDTNQLRDYKITELRKWNADKEGRLRNVEIAIIELKNNTSQLKDNLLEMRAQTQTAGMGTKWQLMVLAAILTTISGLVYALLTLPK